MMYIRDIMTANVVTIPSNTSLADAKRIMEAHRFRRLPVVDKEKLVGLVTERRLEQVSPSKAISLSVWELTYLLDKTKVAEVMERDVVTVSPDMTIEEALAIAEVHKARALVVVKDGGVVGIVTDNDYFYKIVNPILGIGQPGTRVEITGGGECTEMGKIISILNKLNLKIITCHILVPPEATKKDIVVHVDTGDVSQLVTELKGEGFKVSVRKR
jgi:acetoin utilization protein AcuB